MKSPRALCSGNPGKWGFPSIASHQIRALRMSLGARQPLTPHCTLQIPARTFHPHSLGWLISSQLTDFVLNLHSFSPCAMFPPISIDSGSSSCTSNISTRCLRSNTQNTESCRKTSNVFPRTELQAPSCKPYVGRMAQEACLITALLLQTTDLKYSIKPLWAVFLFAAPSTGWDLAQASCLPPAGTVLDVFTHALSNPFPFLCFHHT